MHYTGMAAMQMGAMILWNTGLVVLSVAIGIVAATAALWLSLQYKTLWFKLVAAAAMTVAVAGMPYTDMAAASYVPIHGALRPETRLTTNILSVPVATAPCLILLLPFIPPVSHQPTPTPPHAA